MVIDFYIFVLVAVEIIALLALTKPTKGMEKAVIIVNMCLILLFGSKLINLFGAITNVGNIFYSAACIAQLILLERLGEEYALKTLLKTLAAMTLCVISILFMSELPVLPQDIEVSKGINLIASRSSSFMMASYLAYYISQIILIKVYLSKLIENKFLRFAAASILCQVTDSIIFFPIAFQQSVIYLTQALLVGCLFKITLMLIMYPVFNYTSNKINANILPQS